MASVRRKSDEKKNQAAACLINLLTACCLPAICNASYILPVPVPSAISIATVHRHIDESDSQVYDIDESAVSPSVREFEATFIPHVLGYPTSAFDDEDREDPSDERDVRTAEGSEHLPRRRSHTSARLVNEISDNSARDVSNNNEDNDAMTEWPKIFKFTHGRSNLFDFERDKKMGKIRFSNEEDPLYDGVHRDSFLILHGGSFR